MTEQYLKTKLVKEDLRADDFNLGGDFIEELNVKVSVLIDEAKARARANGRKTVQSKDL